MKHKNSRTAYTAKNIVWGYIGNVLTMLVQFVNRTIFIYTIGVTYLGINGLFSSVLGILSLSELGISTAINFSLYKPVAEGNIEKINALMRLYRSAYRAIALVVALLGLALYPFLPYLVNGAYEISNVNLFYFIFLFNTVSTYFVSYKYGLLNAEQKGYVINNLNSVFTVIISAGQMIILVLTRSYIAYLLVQSALQLVQKIFIGTYINRKYPYLLDKNVSRMDKNETDTIRKNVIALAIHKVGEISVYQTDNIIISGFINVTLVGIVSNYNLIITSVTAFIIIIFNSITSSIGNLIALESKERQLEIFEIYNFIGFWIYGFVCICFWILFQPFITLWIGEENLIDELSLLLLIISQYLTGQRITVNNMKTAGGVFEQDKYVSLLQGLINLVVSLMLVRPLGLAGIYIGTVVSGLFANIVRPNIMYRNMFDRSAKQYFLKFLLYIGAVCVAGGLTKLIVLPFMRSVTWGNFILMMLLCAIVPNVLFTLFFAGTPEFKGIVRRVRSML